MFERGEGVYLYTPEGDKYLDFAGGIAVNALGHSHPHMVKTMQEQVAKLWHVSNLYQIPGLDRLADRLCANSFAERAFFCNSGAEAVECGIKMVRKYHDETGNPNKFRIIAFEGAFHGRTLATISASGGEKITKGFGPLTPGFDHAPFNDLQAVEKLITPETGAILVEPIQGEGGIKPAEPGFLKGLRTLADKHGLLLMFDEIQCGVGRTGKLFAHEWYEVTPDIMSIAKGIGGGFPLGACLATEKAAVGMKPGSHGSTYGSNPLAMTAGNAVLDVVLEKDFIKNVQKTADYLMAALKKVAGNYGGVIAEIRGKGLMIGVKVTPPNTDVVEKLRNKKLLSVAASDNVVRFLPPLVITPQHCDEAIEIINEVCKEISSNA
ncbi:MAG: aspartate aminotransferase family protein [Proteobacteria bacterium]|nr:aspartate aminotransferase family protein [Pseudomonadota bacterium]